MGRITFESSASDGPERDGAREFIAPFRLMGRVLYSLVLREARTRYGSSRLGYVWALVDPVIIMVIFILLFQALGRQNPIAASMPVFMLTGYIPFLTFRNCVTRAALGAASNASLLVYPQVRVGDIVLARVILEVATSVVVYLLLIIGIHLVTGEPFASWYDNAIGMIGVALAIFYCCVAGAMFSSGLARVWTMWPNIWTYMSRPIFLLSGIFFTLSALPSNVRQYMAYNPIAHMIEWFRSVSIPGFESEYYSPFFVLCSATIGLVIGLLIDRYLMLVGEEEIVS